MDTTLTWLLIYGNRRGGKSIAILYYIFMRCLLYAGSTHLIVRRTRTACESSLWRQTLNWMLDHMADPSGAPLREKVKLNSSDLIAYFDNGSYIMFDGLDENRLDKVLGTEYQTIWMNEVSEFDWSDVQQLAGCLNGSPTHNDNGLPIVRKMVFDCNPRFESDWDCKVFRDGQNPVNNQPLNDVQKYGKVKVQNVDEEYLAIYANADPRTRARYLDGDWSAQNDNAIFDLDNFERNRRFGIFAKDLERIVIGVDPASKSKKESDLTGIIVAGMLKDEAYILADLTGKYTPEQVAQKVTEAFDTYQADSIIVETNNGGDWIENGLRQYAPNLPVKQVTASRGKLTRAEPIALIYAQDKVHHVGHNLSELETQMYEFGMERGAAKSPDRMDALVWALWYLFDVDGKGEKPSTIAMRRIANFF
ncbi:MULTISPECIES: phage terminase large subunit [Sphingobium]|uniref:Phage-related protein n=1 Tax=Sphingobium indicum (strain DSM 16413 / CCM 7287 / MTCC 6362 / UT26 / NBRC 101211 / UT26S) TaxID=452662 RepID=D4YZA0_SPHIU|nr:phage terminase large subunit [Sphingobium indicum]BAI95682.1 phage-related protein [Sphingobium indicum UT26S]